LNDSRELFHYKIHRMAGHPPMLAIADYGLIGRSFSENGVTLLINKELYEGMVGDRNHIANLMLAHDIIVLAGHNSVSLAKELGLVTEDSVLRVEGVPHVQIYKFKY
jgi:hypothetical protein